MEKVTTLSTKESCWGGRRLAQLVPLPSGRVDKVSLYLEPTPGDDSKAYVVCEVYAIDQFGFPTGGVAASDAIPLSSIKVPGYVNFGVKAAVGTLVAVVLRVQDGASDDFVSWRYAVADAGGEELMVSNNSGATWTQDPTRKFAYLAYSEKLDAIDIDDQSAVIQAGGVSSVVDNSAGDWSTADLSRTVVDGDTVVIDFSDITVTLVVDQSGSMTWNDKDGVRFDFLKGIIDSLDAAIAAYSPTSEVKYSIVKFNGRKIGKIDIDVEGSDDRGFDFDGVRIVRKIGSGPTGPTDGLVVYEGSVQHFLDKGLTSGTDYQYAVFSINSDSVFSGSRPDRASPSSTATPPVGVARFVATPITTLSGGNDLGGRSVSLSWSNPTGYGYNEVHLVRRTDRFPESVSDGDPLTTLAATVTSYSDAALITDTTYFYRIFTENSADIHCGIGDARTATATTAALDRAWETTQAGTPPGGLDITVPAVPAPAVLEGNSTIQIDWSPSGVDGVKFKLWSRDDGYPEQTDAYGREYDGTLLYSDLGTEYIHRSLDNDQEYFYVLVSVDAVGNTSVPAKFKARPFAASTVSIPAEEVSGFEAVVVDESSVMMSWKNPLVSKTSVELYFGQDAKLLSSVEFADDGELGTFVTFEFAKLASNVLEYVDPASLGLTPISVDEAIVLSNSPTLGAGDIAATVSTTPLSTLLNRMKEARITVQSVLSVKNKLTGAVLAKVVSNQIEIVFKNPFEISVSNDPEQNVSRRKWEEILGGDLCRDFQYSSDLIPGVYAGTNESFHSVIEAKFDGVALEDDATVTLALLDPVTRVQSTLISLSNGVNVFDIGTETDEILDRNGTPTGNTKSRSLLRLDLPPSDIPGDFILQATSTYRGFVQTAEIAVHYEPTLNMDLILREFSPDGVDVAEQKVFVYFGAYDAPQSEKRPVQDFVITSWSIRSTCTTPKERPLYGGDVPGLGVRSYTRGGLAQGVLWGPDSSVDVEEAYEVHVTAQVGGQKTDVFGMLHLGKPNESNIRRILLRSPVSFYYDTIEADGEHESVWEVVARPEEEDDSSIETGGFFVGAVVGSGGTVPSLPDGSVISLTVAPVTFSDPSGNPTQNSFAAFDLMKNVVIKTNLTGTNGTSGTANATVEDGKANFVISVNGRVPPPDDNNVSDKDFVINSIYGVQFDRPRTGIVLTLTAGVVVEVGGKPIYFKGGGSDLINDAPPAFLGLLEPLQPS